MGSNSSTSRTEGALGCGCLAAIVFGIGAAFLHVNIIDLAIIGAVAGAIIGLFVEPGAGDSSQKAKPKRKARDGVLVDHHSAPTAKSVKRRREVSRLEVPGGYVPFEMTKTETKTKDTVKTETRIKTYIDSREVRAVLKGRDVDVLTDGMR